MMLKNPTLILLLFILLPLTACKTWYKPGANEDDLATDQERCTEETQASTGPLFGACLERAGWRYTDMSSAATDAGPGNAPAVEDEATAPGVPGHNSGSGHKGIAGKTTETGLTAGGTTRTTELPVEAELPAQPRHPRGWMKFGADAGQLEAAQVECDETGTDRETFTTCMQAKGWHAIRLTVEEPGDSD